MKRLSLIPRKGDSVLWWIILIMIPLILLLISVAVAKL